MQHYGVPTRLLDFTFNPLIALYFACAERPRTTGRVVFTFNDIRHYDDKCVECLSSLYLYESCFNIGIDDWLRINNLTVTDYLFDIYSGLRTGLLFVKPPYWDERMKMQQSVFLMFHNYVRDGLGENYYYRYSKVDEKRFQYENLGEIYAEQIKNPFMGIRNTDGTSSWYFMVDRISFNKLADSYRKFEDVLEKMDKACADRFFLTDTIEPLDPLDLWYDFSSILIPARYKKTILKQLQQIGIDEAYVYPESEHLAKRIREQL